MIRPIFAACLACMASRVATAGVHVLAEVEDGGTRSAIVVVDAADGCADASRASPRPGTKARALTHCLLRVDAARGAPLEVELGGEQIFLPPRPERDIGERSNLAPRSDGISLEVETIADALHVGVPTVAAVIRVWDRGQPSSHVELNITSESIRLRGLEWIAPGLATIEVVAPAYVALADLKVTVPGGEKRVSVSVDPGPPTEVHVRPPPHVLASRPFALPAVVRTTAGVLLEPTDVAVLPLDGCTGESAAFTCAHVGPARFVVQARHEGVMVPIDVVSVTVDAPPPVGLSRGRWWAATARASADERGLGGGFAASAGLDRGRYALSATVSWTAHRDRLAGLDPVQSVLAITAHEVAAIASISTTRTGLYGRFGAGPALITETASIDGQVSHSIGLVLATQAAVGHRLAFGRQFIDAELGAQAHVNLVDERWGCAALMAFVGVSVGLR